MAVLWKDKNLSTVMKLITCFFLVLAIFTFHGCKEKLPVQEEKQGSKVAENTFTEVATFAGGCFWCTESDFEKLPGVGEVISGYTGGHKENPTYKEVSSGTTGHDEAVRIYYDPKKITYEELLDYFWRHINPTDAEGHIGGLLIGLMAWLPTFVRQRRELARLRKVPPPPPMPVPAAEPATTAPVPAVAAARDSDGI